MRLRGGVDAGGGCRCAFLFFHSIALTVDCIKYLAVGRKVWLLDAAKTYQHLATGTLRQMVTDLTGMTLRRTVADHGGQSFAMLRRSSQYHSMWYPMYSALGCSFDRMRKPFSRQASMA